MRHGIMVVIAALLSWSACAFELGPLAAGDGGGGSGGDGGHGGSGGGVGGYEVVVSYRARDVPSTQTNVPVVVKLDPSRIDYDLTADDGSDLRFFADDGATPLPHEIERWTVGGDSIVWVQVRVVEAMGGSFRMRFGDPAADAAPAASEVWSRYEGVYHFAEPMGATARDSVAGADGVGMGTTSAAGAIGDGFAFDGTATVTVGAVATFDVPAGGGRSFSVWFQRGTTMPLGMSLGRTKNAQCDGWDFRILGDQFANLRMDIGVGSPCAATQSFNTNPFGMPGGDGDVAWHRVTVVMDRAAGTSTVYLDGVAEDAAAIGTTGLMAGQDVVFGVGPFPGDTDFFVGNLDEARIGSDAFDADWVALTYLAEQDQLLEYGAVELLGP